MAEFEFARELQHFSHPHILKPTQLLQGQGKCCRGCMKPIEDSAYHCQPCNFFLHLTCSQIPQQITHPADTHVLRLLSEPLNYAVPSAWTICDACSERITHGFSYHCSICNLDLHPSCANLPTKIKDPNHHHNSLDLCFIPPYPSKAFNCDVCMKGGETSWAYHCFECNDYDSHVNCTQIQPLLNETSRAVDYASSGHHHSQRSCSEPPGIFSHPRPSSPHNSSSSSFQMQQYHLPMQQQQYHPPPRPQYQQHRPPRQQYHQYQNPYNLMVALVVAPAIEGISQALIGSAVQSFMDPDEA